MLPYNKLLEAEGYVHHASLCKDASIFVPFAILLRLLQLPNPLAPFRLGASALPKWRRVGEVEFREDA